MRVFNDKSPHYLCIDLSKKEVDLINGLFTQMRDTIGNNPMLQSHPQASEHLVIATAIVEKINYAKKRASEVKKK